MFKSHFYCRWCGVKYCEGKRTERDGFCCAAHKQAHHRAYKKYVTSVARQQQNGPKKVTRKEQKDKYKKSDRYCRSD